MAKTKEYWQQYYANNPQLREKKREAARRRREGLRLVSNNVPTSIQPVSNQWPLYLLATTITLQLLYEMVPFYSQNTALGWLRACSMEALLIFVSTSFPISKGLKLLNKFMMVFICLLSLYGMSSIDIDRALNIHKNNEIMNKAILDLEVTLNRVGKANDNLVSLGRLTAALQSEGNSIKDRDRLFQLRSNLINIKPVFHDTVLHILCRIVLMVGNIMIFQHLRNLLVRRT